MSVQFNLLPDVKQKYVDSQRTNRTITAIAVLATAGCILILILMMGLVYGVNKVQLSSADSNIKKYQSQVASIKDINRILTVQNQLSSLVSLHQSKHLSSRLFDYLTQLTPTNVKIGRLQLDTTANTLQIDGTADSQKSTNTFIDTLKFTTYKLDGKDTGKKAFPAVIESNFGIDAKGSNYSLNIQFDPSLFVASSKTSLSVPAGITTRSVLDDPNVLFNGQTGSIDQINSQGSQ